MSGFKIGAENPKTAAANLRTLEAFATFLICPHQRSRWADFVCLGAISRNMEQRRRLNAALGSGMGQCEFLLQTMTVKFLVVWMVVWMRRSE